MARLILVLIIIWIALAVIGAVVKALLWLGIVAAILLVITLILGSLPIGREWTRR